MTTEWSLRPTPGVSAPSPSTSTMLAPRVFGTVAPQAAAVATDVLSRAAQRVADSLGSGNSFSFMVDGQTGMTIVKVINRSTGELVRQIPSEEIVHIAQLLQQDEHQPVLDVRA